MSTNYAEQYKKMFGKNPNNRDTSAEYESMFGRKPGETTGGITSAQVKQQRDYMFGGDHPRTFELTTEEQILKDRKNRRNATFDNQFRLTKDDDKDPPAPPTQFQRVR